MAPNLVQDNPVSEVAEQPLNQNQEIDNFLCRALRGEPVPWDTLGAVTDEELNVKDLVEIPHNLKRRLKFIPVKTMEEVLENALESSQTHIPRSRSRSKPAPR